MRYIGAGLAGLALALGSGCGDKEVHKPESNSGYAVGIGPAHLVAEMIFGGKQSPGAAERIERFHKAHEIIMQEEYDDLRGPLEDPERIYGTYDHGDFTSDFYYRSRETGCECDIEEFLRNLEKDPRGTIEGFGKFAQNYKRK